MSHRVLIALIVLGTTATLTAQSNSSFELNVDNNSINTLTGAVVQGDFNNDAKPDIVLAGGASSNDITLRLGNGDGTFQPPRNVGTASGDGIMDLAAADFNNDGKLDIVALDEQAVNVFYGNGDGTFQPPKTFNTAEIAFSVAVGDFNNDGFPDLAVGSAQGSIQIFNNVDGKDFVPGNMINLGSGGIVSVRAGDVNGNGIIALGVGTYESAFVLWGDGHGNFRPVELGTYSALNHIFLNMGDLNQDGNADIMISYNCGTSAKYPGTNSYIPCTGVDVFYGQGNETTFHRLALEATGVNALMPWAADVNGDGIADIVATGCDSNNIQCGLFVWLGRPDGSFDQTSQRYIVSSDQSGGSIVPGDFNRDGKVDFAQVLSSSFQSLMGDFALYINSSNPVPCATSQINPAVTVCQPVDNTYSPSPVGVQATTYDKTPVTALQEYVDYKLVYSADVNSFNITLPESVGPHFFVTKAWDANGVSFRSDRHITVFNGTPTPTCPTALGSATMCLPAGDGSSSPVHILANGYTSHVPTAAQLYIDGNLAINNQGSCNPNGNCGGGTSYVDAYQDLSSGSHDLVFKLWDANGNVYTAQKTVNVK